MGRDASNSEAFIALVLFSATVAVWAGVFSKAF